MNISWAIQRVFSTSFSWLQIHSTPLLLLLMVSFGSKPSIPSIENVKTSKLSYKPDETSPELRTSRLSTFFCLANFNLRYRSTINSIRWGYFPNTFFFNLYCFSIMQYFARNKLCLAKNWVDHFSTHFSKLPRLSNLCNCPIFFNKIGQIMTLRKQSWIGPKIRQQEHIISCRISSQVVWHFVPCSRTSELHFDWLITSEFLQNFFLRFQNFWSKFRKKPLKFRISRKLSSTTICLWTADAVNSPTMFALTIPKLVR